MGQGSGRRRPRSVFGTRRRPDGECHCVVVTPRDSQAAPVRTADRRRMECGANEIRAVVSSVDVRCPWNPVAPQLPGDSEGGKDRKMVGSTFTAHTRRSKLDAATANVINLKDGGQHVGRARKRRSTFLLRASASAPKIPPSRKSVRPCHLGLRSCRLDQERIFFLDVAANDVLGLLPSQVGVLLHRLEESIALPMLPDRRKQVETCNENRSSVG